MLLPRVGAIGSVKQTRQYPSAATGLVLTAELSALPLPTPFLVSFEMATVMISPGTVGARLCQKERVDTRAYQNQSAEWRVASGVSSSRQQQQRQLTPIGMIHNVASEAAEAV